MKKWFALLLVLFMFPAVCVSAENPPARKLTLMVYMCGSNLESGYGSASGDIEEMLGAGISSSVTVLVLAGGSSSWARGYDPEQSVLLEISSRGIRQRWSEDRMNMGESETLTRLLAYGTENYPAEDYALILWDHGGGPNEGVCWDELFSMDKLSLPELTGAIAAAGMERKLKWIGFDACLMSSLEVASALSPYAEYMIASQETEPDFGWNYSFLRGIENDETGADTGRRIVDTYFEGHEDYTDLMTLACLDLSGIPEIADAMDAFFTDPSLAMTANTFALLSKARGSAAGFGKAVRATGEDGYDLVDARGLISSLSGNPEAARLSSCLEGMVVYSRSNEEGAGGVSLYHPYANKRKYADRWRDEYARLGFSAGYTDYIHAFGTILLSGETSGWDGIVPAGTDSGEGGDTLFTLQLTEEQQENFASAQLLVIYDPGGHGLLQDNCSVVCAGNAVLDESGLLSASYSGRSLFIETEDGTLYGPVDFSLTEDGALAYRVFIYLKEGETDARNHAYVVYYLEAGDTSEYPRIVRARVYDPATDTYTNRIRFNEAEYRYLHLLNVGRKLPEADSRGLLPAYGSWEEGEGLIDGGTELRLPDRWRFRWIDRQMTGDQLYAVFQITDVRQNTFCSRPVPVRNPNVREYTGVPETDTGDISLGLTARVVDSETDRSVCFTVTVEAPPGVSADCTVSDLGVSGGRLCGDANSYLARFGKGDLSYTFRRTMEGREFFGLDRFETATLTLSVEQDGRIREIPVSFRFDPIDVSAFSEGISVLGEAEQDGAALQVLDFVPTSEGSFSVFVLIRNDNPWPMRPESNVVFGGIELDGFGGGASLPAGTSRVYELNLWNETYLYGSRLETAALDPGSYWTVISGDLLQRRGITSISDMVFYLDVSRRGSYEIPVPVHLAEPWAIRRGVDLTDLNTSSMLRNEEEDPDARAERILLAENNQYSVSLESLAAGKGGVALGLEIENRTGVPLTVYAANASLNGEPADLPDLDEYSRWTVAPHAVRVVAVPVPGNILDAAPVKPVRAGITFESKEQREQGLEGAACTLDFRRPASLNASRPCWIAPDQVHAGPVSMPDVEIPERKDPEPEITLTSDRLLDDEVLLPENARELIRWIPANLTAEQAERMEKGVMTLVRPIPGRDNMMEIISFHWLVRNADGEPGVFCSGLLLAPESEPDVFLLNSQDWPDPENTLLEVSGMMGVDGNDVHNQKMQTASNITIRAELTENSASISNATLEITEPGGMTDALFIMYTKLFPEEPDRQIPWITELPTGKELIMRIVQLNGQPVRFMLRPVTPEDGVYVMFSIAEKDGTTYSLPMFPYPVQ